MFTKWGRFFLFLSLFWCPLLAQAFPTEIIRFDENLKQQQLYPKLHYQITDSELSVEDIVFEPERAHAFLPVLTPNQVFHVNPGAVWFIARFNYQGQRATKLVVDYNFPSADVVEFYSFDRQSHELHKINRAGTNFPFSERKLSSRSFAIELPFKAGQELDLLVKVQDGAVVQSHFTLIQPDKFYQQQLTSNLYDGILLGLLLLMSAYNILLYLNIREKLHLHFAGFFLSFTLVIAILNGAGFALLWPEYPEVNPAIFYVAVGACLAFLSLSTSTMLNQNPSWWLWLNLLWSGLLLFSPLYIDFNQRLNLLLLVLGMVMGSNLLQVLRHTFSGKPRARTFSLSWLLFFAASLVLLLSQLGYLAESRLWQYLLIASVVCNMALMSYGLAQRMQRANELTTQAHQQAINSLKQYYDIYHNAVEGMFTSTLHGQLLAANRALLNILGYQELSQMELDVKRYGMAKYYAHPDERTHMV
ncbi:MAG: diguanylate cyclase, partial [Gammaproteobacteria bacterium]|nr:diguanylate cyclase [Gammaproteobacteria bacterium]